MGSETLAMEGSHIGSTSVMSIVLRRMKDAILGSSFGSRKSSAASFSPNRTLLSVHDEEGKINLYTIAGEDDPSGHMLPGFVAPQMSNRSIMVYRFLKDVFTLGEDVHMENGVYKGDEKYLLSFEEQQASQTDFNVLQYSISYEFLLKFINIHSKHNSTIDSIQQLQNDPFENRIILSINKGQFILVLLATKEGILFNQLIAFPAATNFIDFCEHGSWCFALDASNPNQTLIHVFNSLDGYYRGSIEVTKDLHLGQVERISVASDLSTLVAYNSHHHSFQIIDIDAYFTTHAPAPTSNVTSIGLGQLSSTCRQDEDENESESSSSKSILTDQKRARNERMKFLRWYEEGDVRLWSQNGEPAWIARSHIEASGWKPIIQHYVPGNWVTLRTSGELKSIDWMLVTPSKIFVSGPAILDDESQMVCTVDRQDTSVISSVRLSNSVLPVMESSTAALYFLDGAQLCALIPDQPTDKSKAMGKITNGLIIFDKPDLAELLYKLNGWDRRQLKLNTLRLGLKYRQLDVIAPALKSLDQEEQFKGSQILLEYTQEHRNVVVQDETFWAQLLKLSMEFVSSIMRQKSASIATSPNAFQEITKYAHILTVLRNTNQKLRELVLKGGSASSATSTSESSPHTSSANLKSIPSSRAHSEKLKHRVSPGVDSTTHASVPITASSSATSSSYKRSISSSIKFSSSLDPARDSPLQTGPSSFVSNSSNSPLDIPPSNADTSFMGSEITATTSLISRPETPTIEFSSPFADTSALHDGGISASLGSQGVGTSSYIDLEKEQFKKKVEGLEKKVDASVEMSSPFGRLLQRWEKLRHVDIIADAIVHGNISMALSYIQWKHNTVKTHSLADFMSPSSPLIESNPAFDPSEVLKWVVNIACHMIYQCIILHKHEMAKTIVNHLGQDYDEHMKQIAWNTSIKELRHILIPGLLSRSVFNVQEVETIHFAEKLESIYPSSIFPTEPNLPPASPNPFSSERLSEDLQAISAALKVANLADYTIDPNFVSNQIATQQDLYETLNPHGKTGNIDTLTIWFRLQYLHNVLTADPATKMRLLLDASLISGQDGSSVINSHQHLSEPIQSIANLMAYFSTHNDWQRLLNWFLAKLDASLPQGLYGTLDERGQLQTSQDIPEISKITIDALVQAFSAQDVLGKFPDSTRSVIASSLANRGIFLPSDTSSFAQLLRVLCSTSSLFRDEKRTQTRFHLNLSDLLPNSRLAPLHLYFIDLCIEYKLIPLLSSYLNHYELARTPESISELQSKLSGQSPTWVTLLLHMRHEDTLFEASLANAQISTRSKTPMSVNAMISSNTIKKRPLMALGSLLYAPVSLNQCHEAPKNSPWYLDNAQLSELCSAFPVVHEALFPQKARLSSSTGLARDHLVLPTSSFDFYSSHHDINLHQLLSRASNFELTPFTTVRPSSYDSRLEESSIQPLAYDFEDETFDNLRFEDHADVAFFLCQGEPFKAYRWLQNHYASISGSLRQGGHRGSSSSTTSTPSIISLSNSSSNLGRGAARPKPNLNYVTSSIPLHEAPKVMRMVRQVAFQHVYDDTIVASCVALLELCEYKSLDLKVDCKSLVRLVDFCSRAPRSIFEEFSLQSPLSSVSSFTEETGATSGEDEKGSAFLLSQPISRREALKHLSSLLITAINGESQGSTMGLASNSNPSLNTSSTSIPSGDASNSSTSAAVSDSRTILLQMSKMLERATEMMLDELNSISKGSSASSASSERHISAQMNHWALLVFFNTVHKLPLGETPLAQLAKRNDWVSFLYYAQVLGYPAEQTLKICDYFTDHSLRDHLVISLSQFAHAPNLNTSASLTASKPKDNSAEEDQKLGVNQIFQLVLTAASRIYPGEALLQLAISTGRPLLSVLALCFPDVTILNCIIVWLSTSVPLDSLIETNEAPNVDTTQLTGSPIEPMLKELLEFASNIQISSGTNSSNRVSRLLKSTSATAFASTQTSSTASQAKTHSIDSLHTLSRFIVVLCTKSQLHYIIRALEIFEPSHILLQFVRALQSFSQCQFELAASMMKELFTSLQRALSSSSISGREMKIGIAQRGDSSTGPSGGSSTALLLGDSFWVQSVVVETCDCLIRWHCTTSFERRELLKVLAISSPTRFETLYREFCLLEKMELVSSVMSEKNGFVVPSAEFIIQELVKRGKFHDAREFASFCDMNVHDVTVLEAEDLLARLRQLLKISSHSSTIDMAKERQSVWRQINALLIQRKCRPDVAGQFFLNKAQDIEHIVTGAPKPSPKQAASPPKPLSTKPLDSASLSALVDQSNLENSSMDFVGDVDDDEDGNQDDQELTVEEAATEQIQLLSLARPWLDGSKNIEVGLTPTSFMLGEDTTSVGTENAVSNSPQRFIPSGGFSGNPNLWVPQSTLDDLLAKILRLSVLAQAESTKSTNSKGSAATTPSKSSAVASSVRRRAQSSLPQRLAKMDLSNVDPEVLESLIGKLLNQADSLAEAEKTSKDLNINSREVLVVKVMTELAKSAADDKTGPILERNNLKQLVDRSNPNLSIDYSVASVVDVLTYVSRVAKHAKECCDRIVAKYKVARHLNLEYDELLSKDPFEIFQFLVLEGAHVLPLTKHFASALCLEKDRIALMLAELCYRAVCDLDGNVSRLVAATGSSGSSTSLSTGSTRGSLGYGDEIAKTVISSPAFTSPSLTPSSSHSDLSTISSSSSLSASSLLQSRVGKTATTFAAQGSMTSITPQPLATFFSNKHWSDFVEMAGTRAGLVGDEILRLLHSTMAKPNFASNQPTSGSTQVSSVAYNVEIELIIRAFASYRVGLDVLKQAKLFDLIEERVPIYVQAQQFKSLVRLVTGIKLYAQLQYILDILVKYDCFDMLLSRNVYHLEDGDDRKELQLALFNFLKANYPSHIDKMKLLFLRFNMFREYADLLQERGWMHLNTMKSRLDPHTLLQALDSFLEAASMYARDKAYGIEAKCLDTANLLQLQFDLPETRIVNLKEAQAQLFITHCPIFSHCFIVAKSYSLLKLTNWIEPVFQQVIVLSNWNFWSDLELQLPLERGLLFSKIVKRVNQELNTLSGSSSNKTLIQTIITNIRLFLDHLDDHYLRLKYARDLGLTDLVDQLNRVLGAEYTTLIIS